MTSSESKFVLTEQLKDLYKKDLDFLLSVSTENDESVDSGYESDKKNRDSILNKDNE